MEEPDEVSRRPGGRSARIRTAVLTAALDLLETGVTQSSLPELAAHAGVAPSSIYRRWGTWENVIADALLASSQAAIPVPDTGNLRQDLIEFATSLAKYLESPRGYALTRAAGSVGTDSPDSDAARTRFWTERFQVAKMIITRGIDRNEVPATTDAALVIETIIAPLHFRRLVTHQNVRHGLAARIDLVLKGSQTP
ncbi:TetR/AcrR family transcriptional regulator C-terminal ligand-binding domain-containing protein [Mycobacterium sp. PDNC021]|uniref:TetR/AcrR family transcriptional regulator n=1 Tax=Mycobacterium sp. PDNC021 TaxID=3391399 RepID=UPI003AAD258C